MPASVPPPRPGLRPIEARGPAATTAVADYATIAVADCAEVSAAPAPKTGLIAETPRLRFEQPPCPARRFRLGHPFLRTTVPAESLGLLHAGRDGRPARPLPVAARLAGKVSAG
ncbi:hypothetical protein ABZ896_47275 [Streptomyces sp. NPDC047072]|uniref:hypothetical protein n=1 Tax=Streptomyces sp. NPDC047072 TaxID=3154809 RepID=UPI0033D6E043